jgi:hypothetical protein
MPGSLKIEHVRQRRTEQSRVCTAIFIAGYTLANRAGLNWHVEPNDEAAGGRVIILGGRYTDDWSLQCELLGAARKAGNAEIDFLFCVPPSDVTKSPEGRLSETARQLSKQGFSVWDGTNEQERRDFPRETDTYRVVQYSSCRGLEGWTVIAAGLDQFWEYRRADSAVAQLAPGSYRSREELQEEEAWRWCFIPLTRPIDTLVVCLSDPKSKFSRAVFDVVNELPDIVEQLG